MRSKKKLLINTIYVEDVHFSDLSARTFLKATTKTKVRSYPITCFENMSFNGI